MKWFEEPEISGEKLFCLWDRVTKFAIMRVFHEILLTFRAIIRPHMIVFVAIVPFFSMLSNVCSAPWTLAHSISHHANVLRFIFIKLTQ